MQINIDMVKDAHDISSCNKMNRYGFALFSLGFRPFFVLAGVNALLVILIWGGVYIYDWQVPNLPFSPMHWHARDEMIFGCGLAVAAGFLLPQCATGLVSRPFRAARWQAWQHCG